MREPLGETIPLQRWEDAAAQIPAALVLDSRGVYDALARSESACLVLKDKRSGLEALSLKRSLVETQCGIRWTHSAAQLEDCMTKGSEETQKTFELLKRRGCRLLLRPVSEHRKAMTYWIICPRQLQSKNFGTSAVTAQWEVSKLPCFDVCLHGLDILSSCTILKTVRLPLILTL